LAPHRRSPFFPLTLPNVGRRGADPDASNIEQGGGRRAAVAGPDCAYMPPRKCLNFSRARSNFAGRCATGTTELGSCPTDATRDGRSRRTIRDLPAMLAPECQREQSLRRSDPVELCHLLSGLPFNIWTHWDDCQGVSWAVNWADSPLERKNAGPPRRFSIMLSLLCAAAGLAEPIELIVRA
jgi:hypothetical protein